MSKIFNILSIEDSEPDFIFIKRSLEQLKNIHFNLLNVKNGRDALFFLYKQNGYEKSPDPDIIILDINIPLIDGHEVLKIIKNDKNLKIIPVIILSTSESQYDINKSYELYANSYVLKTFDTEDLINKISIIAEYWLNVNQLPQKHISFEEN